MNPRKPRPRLEQALADAIAAYQAASVIPHCPECTRSCCRLDPLVLELEWRQVKTFWRVEQARAAFDRQLAAGKGPTEIRAANGLYYAHGKPCPAFDPKGQSCTVYDQPIKPVGCSDFPVYQDGDCVVADLRCEAIDLKALSARLAEAAGTGYRVVQSADAEFPFIVSLMLKRTAGRRG